MSERADLDAEVQLWLAECGLCDAGLPMECTHPEGDPRRILLKVWQAYDVQRATVEPASVLAVLGAHRIIGNNPEDAPECTCGEWEPKTATRALEEHDEHIAAMLTR